MMKKSYRFIGLLTASILMLFTGCDSSFLESDPTDKMNEEYVGESVDNLYYVINGTHRAMYQRYYDASSRSGEQGMMIARDALGEDLVWATRSNGWFIGEHRWNDHRDENSQFLEWTFHYYYRLVLNANKVLAIIDQTEISSEDLVKREYIKGEALMFRAFSHFWLVQFFGERYKEGENNTQLGVSYREIPDYSIMARNTVEEVYGKIHRDLDEAIALLEGYKPEAINHFTLKVARGIKARVLLAQHRYAEAADMAMKAIELSQGEGYELQKGDGLLNGLNTATANSEWIWASIMPSDHNIFYGAYFAFMSWNVNSGNIRGGARLINNTLYDTMSETDIRRKWWDPTGKLKGPSERFVVNKYQTRKFTSKSNSSTVNDLVLMRLSELYLMAAEAYARAGQESEAKTVFSIYMKTRDAEYNTSDKSGEAFIEEIMTNRRIELWGEGFRFTDLKRLNLPLKRKGTNAKESVCGVMEVPAGDVKWQFLIPKKEIDSGKELVKPNEY